MHAILGELAVTGDDDQILHQRQCDDPIVNVARLDSTSASIPEKLAFASFTLIVFGMIASTIPSNADNDTTI